MSAWSNLINESFGLTSLPKDEQRKRRNSLELAIFVLLAGSGFNLTYYYFFPEVNYVSLASLGFIGLLILYFYISKNYAVYKTTLLLSIVVFGLLAQISLGGFVDASGVVLCTLLPALGALIFSGKRAAKVFFMMFIASCIGAAIWENYNLDVDYVIPRKVSLTFFTVNFISIGSIAFFLIQSFYEKMETFQKELSLERDKSEQLLFNILPPSVSAELKESGTAIARGYTSATVIFTDIVGFSNLSKSLTPKELVKQLDMYFRAFDDVMQKHNIEKIKTIGDAYIAVSGIPDESFTHALNAIKGALDLQIEVDKINNSGLVSQPFYMRMGIHSGPLVAGVVGKKKFTYDIWGDTVNIAARLEEHGVPGKINISQSTYNLIHHHFKCTARGKVKVKNMDAMDMYFVEAQ